VGAGDCNKIGKEGGSALAGGKDDLGLLSFGRGKKITQQTQRGEYRYGEGVSFQESRNQVRKTAP